MTGEPPAGKRAVGLPLSALIAGAIGGTFVVGIVTVMLAMTGGIKSSMTTTVAERESVRSPTTRSRPEYGLAAGQIYERDAPGVVFVNASGVTVSQSAGEYLKGEGGEQATATGSGLRSTIAGTSSPTGTP